MVSKRLSSSRNVAPAWRLAWRRCSRTARRRECFAALRAFKSWLIAGLAVDNGDGASFSGFPDDNPPFVTGPFNWSAADTDGLYFKGQVIDLTSKSFPQTQFSPKVHCGTSHGTMMLVRDAKANFYMNPTKN